MRATLALVCALVCVAARGVEADGAADPGAAAYRSGNWAEAERLWLAALEQAGSAPERARLCYDLGNAHFRQQETLEAVGWYSAALRLAPRDADAWANLELARSEAGLEPADRGDLTDTLQRLVSSTTLAESEWGVALALLLLALALAGEALRGGVVWRRLAWSAVGIVALACLPLFWNLSREKQDAWMVVSTRAAAARSEPRPDATRLAELEPGTVVERLDALPDWLKVRGPKDAGSSGSALWVRDDVLFDLVR